MFNTVFSLVEPCFAGTYRSVNQMTCDLCEGNTISDLGASSCVPCEEGLVANSHKTACGPETKESENAASGSFAFTSHIFCGQLEF